MQSQGITYFEPSITIKVNMPETPASPNIEATNKRILIMRLGLNKDV